MTALLNFFAGVGAMALLVAAYLAAGYATQEGERLAHAERFRAETPHCEASIRQYDPKDAPGFYKCAKARKESR
jgi:hypothetical protein